MGEDGCAGRNCKLTAWTFINPALPSELVDVILTEDLAGMKVKRVKVRGQTVRVASVGDLVRMKRASGRPQDLEDVEALRRLR